MRTYCLAGIVIALLVAPSPIWAQGLEPAGLCFRGRPLPRCRSFLVTELGFRHMLNARDSVRPNGFTLDVGWMTNRSESLALGATAFVALDGGRYGHDVQFSVGLKPRLRHWLSDRLSVDASAGVAFPIGEGSGSPGITGDVGLNFGDLFQLTGGLEILSPALGGSDVAWYFGMKGGSHVGVVATLALAVGAAIWAALPWELW
jgi:hypothetical protein